MEEKLHLLIEKAFVYPLTKEKPQLDSWEFDDAKGYWLAQGQNTPLILDKRMMRPRSKKADVETGEDQKGE